MILYLLSYFLRSIFNASFLSLLLRILLQNMGCSINKNHAKDTEMTTSFPMGDNKKEEKNHQKELNNLKDALAYKLRACNVDIVSQKKNDAIGDLSSRKTVIYDTIIEKKEEGPIMLIGYSSGGLLALKVAHKLQKKGVKVAGLVTINTPI